MALWREALLAKAVLEGRTRGYVNHPQLIRFKLHADPAAAINTYLTHVLDEAKNRGFSFSEKKIDWNKVDKSIKLPISQGQLDYELELLKRKLMKRSPHKYEEVAGIKAGEPNDMFIPRPGGIEAWERPKPF